MKTHSTNYTDTFIEIAEDCPVSAAEIPPTKGEKKSVANLQFDLLYDNPYKYTSDDIFFTVFSIRKELLAGDIEGEKQNFFSKGQPCFRASPLTKRYGWGIHSNGKGEIAMFGVETNEYKNFLADESVKKVKAMRLKRA